MLLMILPESVEVSHARLNPDYNKSSIPLGDAVAYFNRGNDYMKKEHDELALADYTKAIQLNPKFSQAYNNRGRIYARQQKYDLAIADFTKAIELNPQLWEAHKNRGFVYMAQEHYNLAIGDFTKTIELNPNDC